MLFTSCAPSATPRTNTTGSEQEQGSVTPLPKSEGTSAAFNPNHVPATATQAADIANDQQVTIETERPRPLPPPKFPPPTGAKRLAPDADAWLDAEHGTVIVDGNIALREGMLEMFACLRNTKEHESIVSANTRAFLVHAALVGLGADPGTPVEFAPTYKPPSGPEIEIFVQWRDEDGNDEIVRAQELIKDSRTGQPMTYPFVFAGSLFWKDPEDARTYYMAEQGDFICISNFGTAMIDIPVESSQSNEERKFLAFTEKIPPLGAPVRLILKPKLPKGDESKERQSEAKQAVPSDRK
jgi:hypothetical protein